MRYRRPADELVELGRQTEAVQTELAARQAELAELEQDIALFQSHYDRRLGTLVAELAAVERELEESKRQIEFYRHQSHEKDEKCGDDVKWLESKKGCNNLQKYQCGSVIGTMVVVCGK